MKFTSRRFAIIAVLGFVIVQITLTPARAQSQPEKMTEARALKFKDLCGRKLTEPPAAFFDRLVKLEGASIFARDPDFISVRDKAGINWSFTVAGHPAHPSVACRKIVEVEGAFHVLTNIQCLANERACEQLVADYKLLDKRMQEAIQKDHQKK